MITSITGVTALSRDAMANTNCRVWSLVTLIGQVKLT
ncbi:unnamed protein product, partial [marine sediment metagenome]